MSNPFLILSDSSSSPYSTSSSKPASIADNPSIISNIYQDVLEYVLLCTVNEQPSSSLVYLAELANEQPENWDKNLVDQALFERLRMTDPVSQLLTTSSSSSSATTKKSTSRTDESVIVETRCLIYLSACYQRLLRQRVSILLFSIAMHMNFVYKIGSFSIST